SVAVGPKATANGNVAVSVGWVSAAFGDGSVAIGSEAYAGGENSVSIGAKSTTSRDNDVSIGGGGLTRTLSNLSDGSEDHDAVNKKQLDDVNRAAKGYASEAQENAVKSANTHTNEQIRQALEHGGSTAPSGYSAGLNAGATGVSSTATGSGAKAEGANSVALGSGSHAQNANEVNIGIWNDDYSAQTTTRTISGLSAGAKPDEAVNKEQLDGVDDKARGYALGAQKEAISVANTYTDDTAKKTLKTANEHTERRAVVAENNAVTRSNAYTDESSSRTLESANTYTNHRSVQAENNAVARSNAYTDNRFGELRKSLQHTEKRLNAGIAGVTAISSIPYAAGNKFSYGLGAGNYQNGNAIAAGVQFRVSQSANVRFNVSLDSAGNNAIGAGFSGGW
ncbi:hypothetical protein DYI94_16140, partial [Salmonella enterica]|nr:hypothetical protein [Salmonella enterica]